MTGVRFREGGFEGRCETCREYWPLDSAFWRIHPNVGWRRCRACVNERQAVTAARRRADPAIRALENEADVATHRAKRHADMDAYRESQRRRRHARRDIICAQRRAAYAALSPEAHEAILAQRRARERARADRARAAS